MFRDLSLKYKLKEEISAKASAFISNGNNDWQKAYDSATSNQERTEIVDRFMDVAFGADIVAKLQPGIDVVESIIEQLGFKEVDNPYIKFIKLYFTHNNAISRDAWIALNDFYANDIINASALFGTGHDGQKHLVFNPYLYSSVGGVNEMMTMMKDYEFLSNPTNVSKLNLKSIYEYGSGNPYGALQEVSSKIIGTDRTLDKEVSKNIRNIIIYKDTNNELGPLQSVNWVDRAVKLGGELASKESPSQQDVDSLISQLQNNKLSTEQLTAIYKTLNSLGFDFTKR